MFTPLAVCARQHAQMMDGNHLCALVHLFVSTTASLSAWDQTTSDMMSLHVINVQLTITDLAQYVM